MPDAKEPLDDTTASQYVNNQQQTDSAYIKSFEIWFTASYNKLGLPPGSQTIEGPEARKYNQAQQRDLFGAHKMERTVHGSPPCVMLAKSIRAEDDYRIKAEIIERLQDAGVAISNDQIYIVWTTVYSHTSNKKAAAKCITVPPKHHHKIKQIVNALSHDVPQPASKMAYPLTYDYIAIQIIPQESPNNQEYTDFESKYDNIDTMIDFHLYYICTLTSTSITGLAGIDLFSTTTKSSITGNDTFDTPQTKSLAQLILDGKYTSKKGAYE
jgi:hypothetical protein